MRGKDIRQDTLFGTVSPEHRMPKDHPLRPVRRMVDEALEALNGEFNALYADSGRSSIPPEKLLRGQLLMVLYSIRSERQLVEQIDYSLLFRWFVGFSMEDEVWHHSTSSKNRDRLLEGEVAHRFFARVLEQARAADLLSKEHFSVGGTLIEALASFRSYRPRDEEEPPTRGGGRNPTVDFRGGKRSRDIHEWKADPDALLFRKSKGTTTKLCYMGHLMMENRHGLVVGTRGTQAAGKAEREAAIDMVEALASTHRVAVGADRNYDTKGFVEAMRRSNATPHMAQNVTRRSSAIDGRTTRHAGYRASQTIRKRIEECFGWLKTIGGLRKSRLVGRDKLDFHFVLGVAAYNLLRMPNLGVASC